MATFARSGDAPSRPWTQLTTTALRPLVIRVLLVLYVATIIVVHAVTLPELFQLAETACTPGACMPGQINQGTLDALATRGISATAYAVLATGLVFLIPIIGTSLAAVTIWQRPTAWLPMLFVISIANCTINASGAWTVLSWRVNWLSDIEWLVSLPMLLMWPIMSAIFPDGRFVPRWTVVLLVLPAFDLLLTLQPSLEATLPDWLMTANGWAWIAAAVICIPWRWHVTTNAQTRRQVATWGFALLPMIAFSSATTMFGDSMLPYMFEGGFLSILFQVTWAIAIIWLLSGFMLAIYLYNLYDVTVVVRRSLVYGTLTLALILLYLMVTGTLAVMLDGDHPVLVNVTATAVIALVFAPLRDWLQQVMRRLLYGDQRDPYGVLTRFGVELERETVPERLLQSIVGLAQDSLRVPGVALQVSDGPGLLLTTGVLGSQPLSVPLRYQGDEIGSLKVARRSPQEGFSAADRRLIDEIARQTGIAVHSVLQSQDLQASRERIVTAREEERRRLRRDLHDGLGPSLAALSLQVEIARDLIDSDPARSADLLDDVLSQTRESIRDIRRLVYELRPPALDDLGLIAAIRAQRDRWEQSGLVVDFDLPARLDHLSAATEVALYRIVQEGVNNILRHADARQVTIALTTTAAEVVLEVLDDGKGIADDATHGIGMHSMRERALELGGSATVQRRPDGGTQVVARFPWRHPDRDE